MLDEREGEVEPSLLSIWHLITPSLEKIAIVAAGPVMNILIAICLYWILLITPTQMLATKVGSICLIPLLAILGWWWVMRL